MYPKRSLGAKVDTYPKEESICRGDIKRKEGKSQNLQLRIRTNIIHCDKLWKLFKNRLVMIEKVRQFNKYFEVS